MRQGGEDERGWMRAEGGGARVCAHGGANGRGNLRVAKTPPLQSGFCKDAIAGRITIQMPPFTPPPCMRIPCRQGDPRLL